MKVALIYPGMTQHGGAEVFVLQLIRTLALRHDVTLLTSAYDETLFPSLIESHIECLGGRGFFADVVETYQTRQILMKTLRKKNYDRVIAINFPAHVWAAGSKTPIIALCLEPKRLLYPRVMYAEAPGFKPHGHRTRVPYKDWRSSLQDSHILLPYPVRAMAQRCLDHQALKQMSAIWCLSDYMATKIRQIYGQQTIRVIGVGAPLPDISRSSERLIVIVSRLEPLKNIVPTLEAFKMCRSQLDGWEIVIVGTGSDSQRLQALAEDLPIRFTGYISDTERDAYYDRAQFVIYPALAEPLGLPVLEAGMQGKAVLADYRGGPAELIQHCETGYLMDMTSPQAIAEVLKCLMSDPRLCSTLGQAARMHLAKTFSQEVWANRLEDALYAYPD